MTAGRPTKYNPDIHIKQVVDLMESGLSLTAAAGEIGVAWSTIHDWMDKAPEFRDAVKIGQAKRTLFLEKRLLDIGLPAPAITATIFGLKNACRQEWGDKQTIEHTGKDGGPIETVNLPADPIEAAQKYQDIMKGIDK